MNNEKIVLFFIILGFLIVLVEVSIGISPRDRKLYELEGNSAVIKNCELEPGSLYYERLEGAKIINKDSKSREIKVRGESWRVPAGEELTMMADFEHGDFIVSCDNKDAGYLIVP